MRGPWKALLFMGRSESWVLEYKKKTLPYYLLSKKGHKCLSGEVTFQKLSSVELSFDFGHFPWIVYNVMYLWTMMAL